VEPRFLCTVLVALVVASASAGSKVTIRVKPTMAFEPANVRIQTHIEADPQNRSMEVVAESEEFYTRSVVDIDGENAPTVDTFYFRNLPAGSYEVSAIVRDAGGGERAFDRCVLIVSSGR